MFVTGRNFNGIEAEKYGLVLESFSTAEEMMNSVLDAAKLIAQKSPLTIRGIKKTLQYTRDNSTTDSLNQIKLWNSAHLVSGDLEIAVKAAFTKTKPEFK